MRITRHLKYIPLALFSIISTLVLLELVLFLSGQYLLRTKRKAKYDEGDPIQITCVGDSHTFGVGTSMQYSYPKQLEKLLNNNNPSQRFSVINLGRPGASPSLQFKELKKFLDRNDTDLVILLTGRNVSHEVAEWEIVSFPKSVKYNALSLRSVRFLKELFTYIAEKNPLSPDIRKTTVKEKPYNNYMNYYLNKIKALCIDKNSRLILLSYYNSSYGTIEKFAEKYNIPYFKFTKSFKMLFASDDRRKYISPDMSHMNRSGNKFFAEELYRHLFLNQRHIDFKINPLLKKIGDESFYRNEHEIKMAVEFEKKKIKEDRNNPYELIHLGHIYMEIGKYESAKRFYMMALLSSNYTDNNTIISPIVNWYLRKGEKENALKICEEILSYNPENSIARYYYKKFLSETPDLK